MNAAKQKTLLLAALLGFAALAFVRGQQRPPASPKRPPPDLVFDPPRIVYSRVFPGSYTGVFHLRNVSNRAIRQATVKSSCFCVALSGAPRFAEIKPGETVDIPYKIDVLSPGKINQALTVAAAGEKREYDAPLQGEAILPLPDVAQNSLALSELPRENADQKTQTVVVTTPTAPEAQTVKLQSEVRWLHIDSRRQGNQATFAAYADANAPEGEFTVPAKLLYTAPDASNRNLSFALTGRIVSQVAADPAVISFGLVSAGHAPAPQQCVLTLRRGSPQPITLRSDTPQVQARLLGQEANKARFAVSLKATRPGEIQSRITLRQAGKTLAVVPVSAFVGQQTAFAVPPK